jgi:hypothetical protein
VKVTVPLPVWLVGEVKVTNDAVEETVQAHPVPAVTPMLPVAPAPERLRLVEPSEYAHGGVGVGDVAEVDEVFEEHAAALMTVALNATIST